MYQIKLVIPGATLKGTPGETQCSKRKLTPTVMLKENQDFQCFKYSSCEEEY